ncbi:lipoprotein-releasing ABC transporter permease subunit LolC [Blochmannia endosymbiont of Camponotus sp.]|uniref:lipoprotein-releasing ABC transporter permease subunit LolC n=1 Tax=Blochmannia endosymbiont of Camponotus sp. TaxID=700220 RepID=UPI0020253C52|nr:lipoprotein-releasing ABC transporter permease subunit LolC [Blochmannia endosymbiont of Camponotus sp.]URJ31113.1 lipoprotein-releasing ABC transporter permease subunit LolC [Blochmannia endosymbiont of Camponotus sp.]
MTYRPAVLFIALRYIFGKSIDQFSRNIYWISRIAIMLGVMAMITVLSVMNGCERDIKQSLLNFIPHVLLTTDKGYVHVEDKPKLVLRQLQHKIICMQPLVTSNVILQSPRKASFGVMLGINPNHFEPLYLYLLNKHINRLSSGKYYIIIGSALAKLLEVSINDQIRVIVPSVRQITPIGYVPSQRLFTVLDIYITTSEVDSYQVLIHQSDASTLMRYPSQCVTGWRLWLHEPFLVNSYSDSQLYKDWVWKDWRECKGSLFQAMKIEKNIMSLLLVLIIIAASFNVISFLVLLILDKQIEIAVLQTYGFTRRQIVLLFMIQGFGNGILGIIFGTGLGLLLSNRLNEILLFFKILPDTVQLPVEIKYYQILGIIFMTFVIVLLATLYPSWRAASVHPAKILRHG